ncbi:MAG: hypothetical protein OXFUSZZB_000048, partial [Candidatus Fervidibacter sp.]
TSDSETTTVHLRWKVCRRLVAFATLSKAITRQGVTIFVLIHGQQQPTITVRPSEPDGVAGEKALALQLSQPLIAVRYQRG